MKSRTRIATRESRRQRRCLAGRVARARRSAPARRTPPHKDRKYRALVRKMARNYKISIKNNLDPTKKLLVLDLDQTLIDAHGKLMEYKTLRPHVREFLRSAHRKYNLVLWSASGMRRIKRTMRELGLDCDRNYRFCFYVCLKATLEVEHLNRKVVVKPLGVLWDKYPAFSARNTIIIDDIKVNFLLNPKSGLHIKRYRKTSRRRDDELHHLKHYLRRIARVEDFRCLRHKYWNRF